MRILNKNKNQVAISTNKHGSFTHGYIDINRLRFKRAFRMLDVAKIAICNENEALNVSAILACLETNTSFTILHPSTNQINTKLNVFDPSVILSDVDLDCEDYYLKIDTKHTNFSFKVGALYYQLNSDINFNNEQFEKAVNNTVYNLKCDDYHRDYGVWVSFDNYFEDYKPVMHTLEIASVLNGILKWRLIKYNDIVFFNESMNMQVDIVNGILIPLSQNRLVTFNKRTLIGSKCTLYTSTYKLDYLLKEIYNDLPKKELRFQFLKRIILKRKLRLYFKGRINQIILNRNSDNFNLIKFLNLDITVLYTNPKVSTFITYNHDVFKTGDFLEGTCAPGDSISIKSRRRMKFGSIYASCKDSDTEEEYFNTGYVGNLKEFNNIEVIGKLSNLIDYHYGNRVEIGKLIEVVFNQPYITDYLFTCDKQGNIIMFLLPNFDYCDIKKWSNRDLHDKIFELQQNIDKSFKDGYYVKLELYSDEQGFDQQTSVILNSIVR